MGKKIYVGNLPFSTTSENLAEMFSSFGEVISSKIILDRDSGRSKGFGFVEMPDQMAADQAIERLHGSDFGGRNLTVNEARTTDRNQAPRAGGYSHNRGQQPDRSSHQWN